MLQLFKSSWIMPNYNAKKFILLPKSRNVDTIEMYILIALENFKFKIISKVLSDILDSIMPIIISKDKKRLVQRRCIKDCITLPLSHLTCFRRKPLGETCHTSGYYKSI